MKPASYKHYLLFVLLLIYAFNTADRLVLGLMLQDIKADLDLSDTQLGLLTGIAFAFFYSIMGIPIARWADRGDRISVISITTLLWGAAMALCGAAGNFLQLLAIRVGVAVGEAGAVPPSNSLIPEYFSRAERPKAVAIYHLGGPLGALVGYFAAGWINQFVGWRATFVIVGIPSLLLAALVWFTLEEPRRNVPAVEPPREQADSLWHVAITLFANKTFRNLVICFSIVAFFGNGILQWQPAYFMRTYGLGSGELGTWFALLYGGGGLIGLYAGGTLASRFAAHNERLQLLAAATAYCGFAILQAGIYIATSLYLAFLLLALAMVGTGLVMGPLFGAVQTLVPARMRAMSIAVIYLCANLIGLGLGPLIAGVLSDMLRPAFGEESLRYALLALCPGYLWAAFHMWKASRTVMTDLARANEGCSENSSSAHVQQI
ncbi:spinster family MFS transporter [Sphingosinicella rhizophila]|uniref:MFS transporter n=1 Tax=Sphingosinicella rhizophila TaxID=3050082 RepID=A0ABU3QCI1_9SPHN|nr:MFS transporter [Sphingosinicella sp. GR2756]MDT9600992.1 MFS transporter [Sphingosinicella sp. GR2756]